MFKHYRELQDVVSLLVYCTSDKSFLLLKETSGEYWIPSIKSEKNSWKMSAYKLLFELFGMESGTQLSPLRVSKVWLPAHPAPCVYHAVYKLTIRADAKKRLKVKPSVRYRLQWVGESELGRLQAHCALCSTACYYVQCNLRGKLISVFSSSRYCGGDNDSGVVLLQAGKLRLIRLSD
ncbi:PREDICTED: uncharacterized protein LOC106101268 [Papilio polytes]|uniref:uncharacterized protein LOC106101268 n=1 Tax=Papilio polytes TaxID=76194 RepID=UPI0006763AB3|nr:PREDICTED: uncharacterized protein LOC106101268 [Papilio polytes]